MRLSVLIILIITPFMLSGCSHAPLKSPCGPTASLDKSPCGHIPLNLASLNIIKAGV